MSSVAVRVEPIPTDPPDCAVITVPEVPTFSAVTVNIPTLILPLELCKSNPSTTVVVPVIVKLFAVISPANLPNKTYNEVPEPTAPTLG